jgi:hypothetical protein
MSTQVQPVDTADEAHEEGAYRVSEMDWFRCLGAGEDEEGGGVGGGHNGIAEGRTHVIRH